MYSEKPEDEVLAKALCSTCPLVIRCGLAAIRRNERFGIWGGWTPAERAELVKGVRRRAG
jgi:hypothetical protein